MDTESLHALVEYYGCDEKKLDCKKSILIGMERGAISAGATIVATHSHKFTPLGVSAFLLLKESHFSIHTWPEHKYAAADFYSCGKCNPEVAVQFLGKFIGASSVKLDVLNRGILSKPQYKKM